MKLKLFFQKLIKSLLYWGIIGFFVWLLYKNAGDYTKILDTLKDANYILLGWGFVLAIGNLAVMTTIFHKSLQIFSKEVAIGTLLPEMISFSFFSISNPLGFNGALAVLIKRLAAKGHPYLKTIFAFFATQLSVNIAFAPILGLTLWYLNAQHQLSNYELFASQLILFLNLAIIILVIVLLVLPNFSITVTKFLAGIANRVFKLIFKRTVVNTNRLSKSIIEIQKASGRFDHSVIKFVKTLFFSTVYHVINISILYLAFQAYGTPPRPEILVSIYGVIVLFTIVSPTPQGIGIVEGLAQLAAVSIGVESEKAVVAILTYRLMTIWIPALIGFLVYRSFKKQDEAAANR